MGPRKQKHSHGSHQQQTQFAQQQYLQQYLALNSYEVDPNLQAQLVSPAPRTNEDLNISVLQRYNPEVMSLEHIATFGTLYEFEDQWEKSVIEGPLFIVRLWPNLESEVRFAVMILNRRGLKNFSYELKLEEHVDATPELVTLTNPPESDSAKIWGIYVFSEAPPSSTTNQPREFAEKIKEGVVKAQQGRYAKEAQNQQRAGNIGHQISVTDLFGDRNISMPTKSEIAQAQGIYGYTDDSGIPNFGITTSLRDNKSSISSQIVDPHLLQSQPQIGLQASVNQFSDPMTQHQQEESVRDQRGHLLNLFLQAGGG